MEIVNFLRFLRHRDDLIAKLMDGQERGRRAEPCVEEDMTRRNRRLLRFLQETEHDLGCLPLCKFSSLAATRAYIHFLGGGIQTVLWILGRQEHMADGQEGAAVRPAERKHTEAVGEAASRGAKSRCLQDQPPKRPPYQGGCIRHRRKGAHERRI